MKKNILFLNISLCLLVIFLFFQCGIKTSSECKSRKIQLLLEDLFNKKDYYPTYSSIGYPTDSSQYYVYLYSTNIIIPKKEFYLHWSKDSEPSYPDSVLLKEIDSPIMKFRYSHQVSIKLLEVNEDTTKLKIALGYSTPSNTAIDFGTFSYSFDEKNCKWIVLDSTLVRY